MVYRAYERTIMIVTTSLSLKQWVEVLGSERLKSATLGHLPHCVHSLEANGASYRRKDAKTPLNRYRTLDPHSRTD